MTGKNIKRILFCITLIIPFVVLFYLWIHSKSSLDVIISFVFFIIVAYFAGSFYDFKYPEDKEILEFNRRLAEKMQKK